MCRYFQVPVASAARKNDPAAVSASFTSSVMRTPSPSPRDRPVVLQEQPPHVLAGAEPREDRIEDARRTVDDVERRRKAVLPTLALGERHGVLVRDPAGVDAVHVDAILDVVGRGGAR